MTAQILTLKKGRSTHFYTDIFIIHLCFFINKPYFEVRKEILCKLFQNRKNV